MPDSKVKFLPSDETAERILRSPMGWPSGGVVKKNQYEPPGFLTISGSLTYPPMVPPVMDICPSLDHVWPESVEVAV